jgi:hypothetical protein
MLPYQPQPGDIGLVTMPGFVGRLIRLGQWLNGDGFSNYQHAYVVVGDYVRGSDHPGETTKIVEAMPGGALLSPLSRYDNMGAIYLRCPDGLRRSVADAALRFIGTPYSPLDYLSLAARRFHIPAPHLRAYIRSSGHMICSQLADSAALDGGWHLFEDGRWEGDVTPLDLYRLYERQLAEDLQG